MTATPTPEAAFQHAVTRATHAVAVFSTTPAPQHFVRALARIDTALELGFQATGIEPADHPAIIAQLHKMGCTPTRNTL